LRIIQILPKTTIVNDVPRVSAARQVSARYLLGTVPVEADGSAFFTVPAGVPLYFQAVGEDGMAVQSMRSVAYVQPGETLTCGGCHEPRGSAPPNAAPLAAQRAPSAILPGPDGSMPFSYPRLVQPILDKHCVRCHGGADAKGGIRLTGAFTPKSGQHSESYQTLATRKFVHWFDSINGGEWVPRTYPGQFGARASRLIDLLRKGHYDAKLSAEELERLSLWIDLNVPFYGVYEPAQVAEQRRGGGVPLAAIAK
jgi:cytochrome c553